LLHLHMSLLADFVAEVGTQQTCRYR